uniref:Uncharacterized protein n=1 Tax=Arundo donax TaxID=35708 RepID=A0A0A8ZFT1_ARUDO
MYQFLVGISAFRGQGHECSGHGDVGCAALDVGRSGHGDVGCAVLDVGRRESRFEYWNRMAVSVLKCWG